jgi:colanic acid biosynthesis glycosyl transferase WcaI
MKVLITGLNFAPELTGIGKYSGEMAQWLCASGIGVRAVVAPPYYPGWSVAAGHSGFRYRIEQLAGARVFRCPLYVPARPSGLKRILHLLTFALSSGPVVLWQAIRWRPDVIVVIEPPLVCTPVAWLAARLCGAKLWLHVQDFEVDAAFDLGVLRSGWARRALLALERVMMSRCDRVSTISNRMLERVIAKGVAPERSRLFPNWSDFEQIRPLASATTGLRSELGISAEATVLLYSGTFAAKQGLGLLVEMMRSLDRSRERVVLLLCGVGPEKDKLEKAASDLANVVFAPLQPLERLNELMNTADIHLLPQRADAQDLVMPSKLTTMLASGRVVVAGATPSSEVGRLVGRVGVLVPPGDARAMAEAVAALIADPERRQLLGMAGRVLARESWDIDAVLSDAFGDESMTTLGIDSPVPSVAPCAST